MYGDEFKLASLDFMGSTAELEAKAQQAAKEAGDDFSPPDRQEGADSSGKIRVIVDRQGTVTDVQVSREWRESLQATEFAAALYSAYTAALSQAVAAEGLAALLKDERKTPEDREWDEHLLSQEVRESLAYTPPEDEHTWLRATWDKIYELDDKLHNLGRATPEAEAKRVSSPYGHFVFTHQGPTVTGITGDSERIRAADPNQLRTEAMAAFRAAQLELE